MIENDILTLARQYNRGMLTDREFVEYVTDELQKFPPLDDDPLVEVTVIHIIGGCASLVQDEVTTLDDESSISDIIQVERETALGLGVEKMVIAITPRRNTDFSFNYCGTPSDLRL